MNCQEISLQDEDGALYNCIIPMDDYNKIIEGDYDLANKYLQKEIEKKHRLLAFQLLTREKNKTPLPTKIVSPCSSHLENIENTDDNTADLESSRSSNEVWSYDAVLALISSMATHYDDLNHPKKKKHVFSNISNELLSRQFVYTEKACYNKWRSLLRSYKTTKDKRNTTGQGATRFMFFNQLNELLGDKPSHSFGHTIESYEDTSNSSCFESSDVGHTVTESEENTNHLVENSDKESSNRKRKRKLPIDIREEAKCKRHAERMEVEQRKLNIEEKKLKLLEKFIEKL